MCVCVCVYLHSKRRAVHANVFAECNFNLHTRHTFLTISTRTIHTLKLLHLHTDVTHPRDKHEHTRTDTHTHTRVLAVILYQSRADRPTARHTHTQKKNTDATTQETGDMPRPRSRRLSSAKSIPNPKPLCAPSVVVVAAHADNIPSESRASLYINNTIAHLFDILYTRWMPHYLKPKLPRDPLFANRWLSVLTKINLN